VTTVSLGAFISGKGTRTSIAAGMSLAQIGEFSFIIAGLGLSLGAIGPHVYPVAVAVSAITTLLTPALIKRSQHVARFVDRKLPKPLQTVVSFYEGWLEKMKSSRAESRSRLRKFVRTLAVDVAVIAAVIIATSLSIGALAELLTGRFELPLTTARLVVVSAAGVLVLPFCVSVLRTTHRFGRLLGEVAIPSKPDGALDLGHQPRRVIEAAVRLAGILIAGSALVAITQPFLPGYVAAVVLLVAVVVLAISFWRTARGLQGHVRAAAQAVIEVLSAQRASDDHAADPLAVTHELFPGLGAPVRFRLRADSRAVGRSLSELDLRSATGATVLAIVRGKQGFAMPDAHAPLQAGDVLAIAGTDAAVAAAAELLGGSAD
jgi:CPA2 family monovalent cation:H+ antiporter-2